MRLSIFFVFAVILVSCSPLQASQNIPNNESQTPVMPTQSVPVQNTTVQSASIPVNCTPNGSPITQRGDVVIYFSNGKKETLFDYCENTDQPAFERFKIHYYCDGLNANTNIYECSQNCTKGACS